MAAYLLAVLGGDKAPTSDVRWLRGLHHTHSRTLTHGTVFFFTAFSRYFLVEDCPLLVSFCGHLKISANIKIIILFLFGEAPSPRHVGFAWWMVSPPLCGPFITIIRVVGQDSNP